MASSAENKKILQEFQGSLQERLRGNNADLATFFSDDIVWHFPQSTATEGVAHEHRGRDAVMAMFSGAVEQFYVPSSMQFEYHSFTAEEDRVHMHFTLRATTSTGRDYENQYQSLFRFRDGKIAEVWEYFDTAYLYSIFSQ